MRAGTGTFVGERYSGLPGPAPQTPAFRPAVAADSLRTPVLSTAS
jgi:hypothetical protein